jgi:hypothetical protein
LLLPLPLLSCCHPEEHLRLPFALVFPHATHLA